MASDKIGADRSVGSDGGRLQIAGSWVSEVFDRSLLGIVQTDPSG
jgi:hypothetical protein